MCKNCHLSILLTFVAFGGCRIQNIQEKKRAILPADLREGPLGFNYQRKEPTELDHSEHSRLLEQDIVS